RSRPTASRRCARCAHCSSTRFASRQRAARSRSSPAPTPTLSASTCWTAAPASPPLSASGRSTSSHDSIPTGAAPAWASSWPAGWPGAWAATSAWPTGKTAAPPPVLPSSAVAEEQKNGHNDRVLVVTAHPDDPEFGFGASIAKLAGDGSDVFYVICTDGCQGGEDPAVPDAELSAIRYAEQRAAAEVLGVKDVVFLGFRDGSL